VGAYNNITSDDTSSAFSWEESERMAKKETKRETDTIVQHIAVKTAERRSLVSLLDIVASCLSLREFTNIYREQYTTGQIFSQGETCRMNLIHIFLPK
jgi:hypothetical protein